MIIIDGHNLIPKIEGLSLEEIDDEERLIALLQRYARTHRGGKAGGSPKQIEVFFDKAPPGSAGVRKYGSVAAHFVQIGMTADEAIRQYVKGLGKSARNVTVVSSDREVQANARALQAAVIPSEDFARQLAALPDEAGSSSARAEDREQGAGAPAGQLDTWYSLFGFDPHQAEKPIEPPPPAPKKPRKSTSGKRKHHGFPKKE